MTIVEIKSFEQVILFNLQRKMNEGKRPALTFSEIWKVCAAAGPYLPFPIDPANNKKFVRAILDTINSLHDIGVIAIQPTGDGKRIELIRLEQEGALLLNGIVFGNQTRLGIS
jgi:hypothetical protein